jgi:hypothetical protein
MGKRNRVRDEFEYEYEYDWGGREGAERVEAIAERGPIVSSTLHRRAAWKRALFPGCDITTEMIEAKRKSGVGTYVAIAELNASDTSTLCEHRAAIAKSQKK